MSEFKRARSDEQKLERFEEVKAVTAKLFENHSYHEITLSTIGEQLGWTRANVYKYFSSKEEIFLELSADARDAYFEDLAKAFSKDKGFSREDIAKKWASICDKNRNWAIYGAILVSIVEENVSMDRLKAFKKGYYDGLLSLTGKIAKNVGVPEENFAEFFSAIHYHACGLSGVCEQNEQVKQAIKELGIKRQQISFKKDMQRFIEICLKGYSK